VSKTYKRGPLLLSRTLIDTLCKTVIFSLVLKSSLYNVKCSKASNVLLLRLCFSIIPYFKIWVILNGFSFVLVGRYGISKNFSGSCNICRQVDKWKLMYSCVLVLWSYFASCAYFGYSRLSVPHLRRLNVTSWPVDLIILHSYIWSNVDLRLISQFAAPLFVSCLRAFSYVLVPTTPPALIFRIVCASLVTWGAVGERRLHLPLLCVGTARYHALLCAISVATLRQYYVTMWIDTQLHITKIMLSYDTEVSLQGKGTIVFVDLSHFFLLEDAWKGWIICSM
jgi:hypothetical protein